MKKRISWMVLITMTVALLSVGCGESSKEQAVTENAGILESLESGTYYVMHEDKTVEPIYFGCATFGVGSTADSVDDNRIMWFKDDFANIPTLYSGDKLIFYSEEELDETFKWERFEDIGFSVGICHLTTTKTGRYQVSTNPDDNNTYPGSDADQILLIENSSVIIDTIGGMKLREKDNEITPTSVSKCGSLLGLSEGDSYDLELYSGTNKIDLRLTADIRFMCPMELATTQDYDFENNTIIDINIPDEFASGYYLVNGQGMFRYCKEIQYGQAIPDDREYYNVPVQVKGDTGQILCSENINLSEDDLNAPDGIVTIDGQPASGSQDSGSIDWTPSGFQGEAGEGLELSDEDYIRISEPGQKTLSITLTTDREGDGLPDPVAYVTAPSGEQYEMVYTNSGKLVLSFTATESGTYTVTFYNLEDRDYQMQLTEG